MFSPEQSVRTTCSYCGVGCGIQVRRDPAGRLQLEGDASHPVNRGHLCSKGQALHHVVQDTSDRLLFPQMRRSRAHPLERVDWDTALGRAAAVFRATIDRFGPESVGLYVSGQCLTEEYYVANKLVKGFFGCNNIDTNSRLCMSSAVAGYKLALGDDLCPVSYEDIEQGDCYLIAGANPAFCHPILFGRLERHKEANPSARIIVVDPRRTQTCAVADLHLQIQPGTDVVLYNAIARALIEGEWVDRTFVQEHTAGFERLREVAMARTIADAATQCRIAAEDIHTAAAWIGEARAFQSWWAMGLNQSVTGVDNNLALLNLSLITGQIGRPGSGPFSLTGQPNAMGGREVGGLTTMLAAHRNLANPEHRAEVARHWGVASISEKPGLTATEMFDALDEGRLRAVWIICTNPAVSLPDLHRAERGLRSARFVVVQDISSLSDTCNFADVLLPAAGWLEKQGTMTNSERRVTLLNKFIDPPGEALPDAEILCRFAAKMGWGPSFNYQQPEDIFAEHRELTRGTAIDMTGITYERLQREGSLQWPCPSLEHPGTPRLFTDGQFATADHKARLHAIQALPSSDPIDEDHPFILTTGRLRDQWHTMTRTGKVNRLRQHEAVPFVEMHPEDAAAQGFSDGAPVRVSNERGEVTVHMRFSEDIKRGVLFLPMHWSKGVNSGQARTNLLTSASVDPISKQPGFKYAAVRVTSVPPTARRILIAGAGAAALQFIGAFRKQNKLDTIQVFAQEATGFYDRIRLPEYIAQKRAWPELVTCTPRELENLNVQFHPGLAVAGIDREKSCILDAGGTAHAYDALIIATGSRATLPRDIVASQTGVYTLRTRSDADAIQAQASFNACAVIVGGGLLGIEVATALHERGVRITLLHRSTKLMGAQLDDTASQLLRLELQSRGIEVVLQDSVALVHGEEKVLGVRTKGGVYHPCDLLVFAVGTQPNDTLARQAGLPCGDGIIVDDGMRTADPRIYAIGECAEHAGQRHGTSLAAGHQATVAAAQVNGDTTARYSGTVPINILKAPGISLASVGVITPLNQECEQVVLEDRAERLYMKCFIHRDRLIGAILLGDTSFLPQFRQWIETGLELNAERRGLLRPGGAARRDPVKGRLVCSCMQVGLGNLDTAIAAGSNTLEALCVATGAGTGCGSCRSELKHLLERTATVPA